MNVKGFVTVFAGCLACSIADADWHFSIRRIDGRTHWPFSDFNSKEISVSDVANYLPNWNSLQWTEIKDSMTVKSESYGVDVEFKVNVQSTEDGSKTHREVIDAFLEFMRKD
jgi:hypothetical protein